jgi:hypothetical protein
MSGRVFLLGVGLVLVALAFLLTDALLWRPGVTEANVQRIRRGKTLAEVEAVLGQPSRCCVYRNCGYPNVPLGERYERLVTSYQARIWWHVNGVEVGCVTFRGGRVIHAFFDLSKSPHPSPFARLCAWLGW